MKSVIGRCHFPSYSTIVFFSRSLLIPSVFTQPRCQTPLIKTTELNSLKYIIIDLQSRNYSQYIKEFYLKEYLRYVFNYWSWRKLSFLHFKNCNTAQIGESHCRLFFNGVMEQFVHFRGFFIHVFWTTLEIFDQMSKFCNLGSIVVCR